jgi:small subunit ribosomal protein S17
MSEKTEKALRTVEGRVVSNKMDKTVTVLIERQVKHELYGKYIRRSTKLHAHDAANACNEGDVVRLARSRRCPRPRTGASSKSSRARPNKEDRP